MKFHHPLDKPFIFLDVRNEETTLNQNNSLSVCKIEQAIKSMPEREKYYIFKRSS